MSSEPCALGFVAIMIVVYFIIRSNNKHQEKMELIRMKQFRAIKKG